ncbi:MAG: ATP-binding cassette domain-containing protein [Candidatus Schekmanbacteria bacterium]|nr:ATP-binding cassette domain-containing protein [Candidatus Schekmanbacteria bacterium]
MAPPPTPLAKLENITFWYEDASSAPPVLENVDLTIEAGEFLGIIGPNGGGKTTLLRILLGQCTPQRGTVQVMGARPEKARARIGYVPQVGAVDPSVPATAFDVVLMGRLSRTPWGFRYGSEHKDAAHEALRLTGTESYTHRPISSLSGGQRQRVLIARALAADARLLLLDEPTTGVDLSRKRDLLDLLHRLNERMTIVMVSHDVHVVCHHLRRIALVNRTLSLYSPGAITPEDFVKTFLGVCNFHADTAGPAGLGVREAGVAAE